MKQNVGIITIGQTPRTDMIPAIKAFLPKGTVIIEKGVLDGRSDEDIHELQPEQGQTTLVSRLQSGASAIMAKEKILPIMQSLITELNQARVSLIILACTGKFPLFTSGIPIIYPDFLLNHVVKGTLRGGLLGVILPLPEQAELIIYKWKEVDFIAIPAACSPYTFQEEQLINAVKQLDQYPVKAILLDCMGYTQEMKSIAQTHTSKPVILARNIIYGVSGEFL